MTAHKMLSTLIESGAYGGIPDIAHATGIGATTLYTILRYEGGHSKRVRAKLTKVYKASKTEGKA